MNPISRPTTTNLGPREWHERLGHACDKTVLSFLKQHVPSFDRKNWRPFYCETCAAAKSTHRLAKARTNVPKKGPLDLLVSDIMGPFATDPQGHTGCNQAAASKAAIDPESTPDGQRARVYIIIFQPCPWQNWGRHGAVHDVGEWNAQTFLVFCLRLGMLHTQSTLYPFGAEAIAHIASVQQAHKVAPRGIACRLLKPLMPGGWLLWEPMGDKIIQSASVIFPRFQSSATYNSGGSKGLLSHIVNRATLGSVPTEQYFWDENVAIDTLPLTKDLIILEHLGQALSGAFRQQWRAACKRELDQMLALDVWEEVIKTTDMKTLGHHWVFDIKRGIEGG
ncbi:hypothetical protein O181_003820 [Austropuccinia psidii MF-1]|uniref:GAG-pre-integrase domain-containing protein n=1 Tax=Austropuccinia psidii MF-1 TaxID=1389203 RepID=A0A9Q3BF57_9BASI|nr:hypothetical protein [Austropuccinia psidii MF-1]